MDDLPDFTIVGSGLAGALLACGLGKAGYRVDLYEKRADPRVRDLERGRSINLALSVRGIHALREVGLAEEVLKNAIPMRGRMIHSRAGTLTFQPYGKDDREAINSVSRAGLNMLLLNAAARCDGVRLFFQHRCTGIELSSSTIHFDVGASRETAVPARVVIGADGAYSAVRTQLQKLERFNYQQDYQNYGYKELSIPPGPSGEFRLEKHALHIWPRQSFMMIALPNLDGSFTCTLFWPYEGPNSFAALQTDGNILAFFQEQFPDAVPLLPALVADYRQNQIGPLVTIRCQPWHFQDKVVLLGDACHAVVPFLGQGMNAAFEDCTVLTECLKQHGPDWKTAFHAYESRRKENVDALADLAIDNFLEMRDKVRSQVFLLRKRTEILLHRLFPRWFLPLYTMITFTRIPYAEARRRARRQEWIVLGVAMGLAFAVALALAAALWYTFSGGS